MQGRQKNRDTRIYRFNEFEYSRAWFQETEIGHSRWFVDSDDISVLNSV